MASLTHVCVWSKNGWKRITPEEVAREHSRGGVSARSGIFMCSLCGQYVTFFNGRVQAPHFRHSSAEADKSCPERMYVHGYDYTYAAGEHELPIRIVNVTDYGFEFELGLLAVPRIVLNQQEKKNVTVIPSDKAMTPFVYSFERLNAESITYVSIGEYPCESYTVISSDEIEKTYWPRVVEGIKRMGEVLREELSKKNIEVSIVESWAKGGNGAKDIAQKIVNMPEIQTIKYCYDLNDSIVDKVKKVAQNVYGAENVIFSDETMKKVEKIKKLGYGNLPICIAKTQYSFSDDAKNLKCEEPFTIHIREINLKAGAGFVVAMAGKIMTMPGLPKIPAAESIGIDKEGNIVGIF